MSAIRTHFASNTEQWRDLYRRIGIGTPLPAPKPGTHASHFGPWFDAIGNDPYAWQRAAVWSHAGRVAS